MGTGPVYTEGKQSMMGTSTYRTGRGNLLTSHSNVLQPRAPSIGLKRKRTVSSFDMLLVFIYKSLQFILFSRALNTNKYAAC